MSNWDYYVKNNPDWKKLELEIEHKQITYLHKRSGKTVETVGKPLKEKTKISVVNTKLVLINKISYADCKVKGGKRGLIPIGKIRKPSKAGKQGTTGDEEVALKDLDKLIKSHKKPITIEIIGKNKRTFYMMKGATGAKTVAGTPKADFGITAGSKMDIFISHKKAGGAKAFQQYSGVSPKAGAAIYNHPEVKRFLRKLVSYMDDDQLTVPCMALVKDKKLINLAIFGPDFRPSGKNFGTEHCQVIGQGNPILKPSKKKYTFELHWSDHYAVSGDLSSFKGDYTPVLGATFRRGRKFEVDGIIYNGARVGIYPIALMKGRSGLKVI